MGPQAGQPEHFSPPLCRPEEGQLFLEVVGKAGAVTIKSQAARRRMVGN